MRDLKFRALRKHKDGTTDLDYSKNWVSISEFFDHLERNYPEVIVVQFTGLKDMNDKEIYEDDLILVEGRTQFRIYYSDISACYRAVRVRDGWHFDLKELYPIDYWEVVGSIHENKELPQNEN